MPADFVLILILGCTVSCVVGCASAMAGQRYERRKWERRFLERAGLSMDPTTPRALSDQAEARLERLEQAVDTIAIEMERIGEGQRFVTKLLAERKTDSTTPRSPIPGAVHSKERPPA